MLGQAGVKPGSSRGQPAPPYLIIVARAELHHGVGGHHAHHAQGDEHHTNTEQDGRHLSTGKCVGNDCKALTCSVASGDARPVRWGYNLPGESTAGRDPGLFAYSVTAYPHTLAAFSSLPTLPGKEKTIRLEALAHDTTSKARAPRREPTTKARFSAGHKCRKPSVCCLV